MSLSSGARANFIAICGAVGAALGVGLTSGNWAIGIIVGLAVGGTTAEKMRRRAGLPERRALIELGRKDRKPD
jgi:uncharacterized membrane protein